MDLSAPVRGWKRKECGVKSGSKPNESEAACKLST